MSRFYYDNLGMMALWDDHRGRCLCWCNLDSLDMIGDDLRCQYPRPPPTFPRGRSTRWKAEARTTWPQVEAPDKSKVKHFVDTNSFRKMIKNAFTDEFAIVDAIRVRTRKRAPDGSEEVRASQVEEGLAVGEVADGSC